MYLKKMILKMIFLFFIALLGSQTSAYAEPNESVKALFKEQEGNKQPDNEKEMTPKKEEVTVGKTENNVGVTFFDFIKMIIAFLFVIALLYTVLKIVNKKGKSYQSTQLVENLGGTSLGSNRSVQIIKVGNQILVVGVGESIQLLKEITNNEEYRGIIENYNNKMEQLIQPSDIVTKVLEKLKQAKKSTPQKDNQFASLLSKQLNDFSNGRKKLLDDMEKEGTDER